MTARHLHSFFFIALAVVLFGSLPSLRAAEETPRSVVTRLNGTLIDVMQDADALGFQGRYDRLAPVLADTFNFALMAKVSIGPHWRKLSKPERARLVEAFGRMSIATFAARFNGYSGEQFEVIDAAEAPRKSILVRNRLIKNTGEPVEINYLLRPSKKRWRVIDVYLDAKYSELAIKRSEYSTVVKNDGFDELIRVLDEKIAKLAAEG